MRKVFSYIKVIVIVFFLILAGYTLLRKKEDITTIVVDLNTYAEVNELYFYGNHFNIKGTINNKIDDINHVYLVFLGTTKKLEYKYDLEYDVDENILFKTNDYINEGLILDNIKKDFYNCYIQVVTGNLTYNYIIKNKTNYPTTKYYTLSNYSKNILNFITENEILKLEVSENNEQSYDIVIDPGHGGADTGACFNNKCEINYTLDLSKMLKQELENLGYKVALTRNEDVTLPKYGDDNRVYRVYTSKAKLVISIHLNSGYMPWEGMEIYTSTKNNYVFARNVISNLSKIGNIKISNNTFFKVEEGIYTRTFSSSDVNGANENGVYPNVSTDTNYYFMIRETGGYMTGAYVDGREGEGENKFRNTNVGVESYILELCYINSLSNIEDLDKNKEKYMENLSLVIDKYLKKEA